MTRLKNMPIAFDRAWLAGEVMLLSEAAKILGTSPDNLRGAIKRGSLNATKIGRDWIVTTGEVEKYGLEHRRYAPTDDA